MLPQHVQQSLHEGGVLAALAAQLLFAPQIPSAQV